MGVKGNHLTQVRKKVVEKFVEMCHVHSPRCTDQDVPESSTNTWPTHKGKEAEKQRYS